MSGVVDDTPTAVELTRATGASRRCSPRAAVALHRAADRLHGRESRATPISSVPICATPCLTGARLAGADLSGSNLAARRCAAATSPAAIPAPGCAGADLSGALVDVAAYEAEELLEHQSRPQRRRHAGALAEILEAHAAWVTSAGRGGAASRNSPARWSSGGRCAACSSAPP
ncbi:MAG UNVERIFIED_CONTAM: hypothetical protein LVR18_19185 [Planctomycetaceae bacterium]